MDKTLKVNKKEIEDIKIDLKIKNKEQNLIDSDLTKLEVSS